MPRAIRSLSSAIEGRTFFVSEKLSFKVTEAEYYPEGKIGIQHRSFLSVLRQGALLSVSFYGRAVPVIVVDGGVSRLKRVEVEGQELQVPQAISRALGVGEPRRPILLQRP